MVDEKKEMQVSRKREVAGTAEDTRPGLVFTPAVDIFENDDAITVLDRAADLEQLPTANTMLMRLRTYYNYGKETKNQAESETDPVAKAELTDKATGLFNRAIEIGVAMTNNFPATADGFFYLSLAQLETGDYAASDANYKTYEELQSDVP